MAGHGSNVKRKILDAAVKLWPNASARKIADDIGVTHGAVLYHFDGSTGLQNAIADHAVCFGHSKIIVHLCSINHPAVAQMDDAERQRHMDAVR